MQLQHIFKHDDMQETVQRGDSNIHIKVESFVNDGVTAVDRYNATLLAECIAMSVNSCIQAPFANECNMRMTKLDRTWSEDLNHIE